MIILLFGNLEGSVILEIDKIITIEWTDTIPKLFIILFASTMTAKTFTKSYN